MVTKIERSLRNLNRLLDDDYKKLYDKCETLKMSYNSCARLLNKLDLLLGAIQHKYSDMEIEDKIYVQEMRAKIDMVLKCPCRYKMKGVKNG